MEHSYEEQLAHELVQLACVLNKQCGSRRHNDNRLEEYSGYSVNIGGLESAIHAPFQILFGTPRFDSVYDQAAALIVNIAKGHHFGDGNKRTALALGLTFLQLQEITVIPPTPKDGMHLGIEAVTITDYETAITTTSTKLREWSFVDKTAQEHRGFIH